MARTRRKARLRNLMEQLRKLLRFLRVVDVEQTVSGVIAKLEAASAPDLSP